MKKHKIIFIAGSNGFVGKNLVKIFNKKKYNVLSPDRKILDLRPGITGPTSLKYYNEEYILSQKSNPKKYNDEVIFPDKVKINMHYFHNRSFFLDLKIIFATIFRVF